MFHKSLVFAFIATIVKVLFFVASGQLHGGFGAIIGAFIGSGLFFLGMFVLCLIVLAIMNFFAKA